MKRSLICLSLFAAYSPATGLAQAPSAMPAWSSTSPNVMLTQPYIDRLRALGADPVQSLDGRAIPQSSGLPSLQITLSDRNTLTRAEAFTQIINRSPDAGALRFALAAALSRMRTQDSEYLRDPTQTLSLVMRNAFQEYRTAQQNVALGNLPQATREMEWAAAAIRRASSLGTPLGAVLRAERDMLSSPIFSMTGSPLDSFLRPDSNYAQTAGLTASSHMFLSQSNPLLVYQFFLKADSAPELLGAFDLALSILAGARTNEPIPALQARFAFLDDSPMLQTILAAARDGQLLENRHYRLTLNMNRHLQALTNETHEQRRLLNSIVTMLSSPEQPSNLPETQRILRAIDVRVDLTRDGVSLMQAISRVINNRPLTIAFQGVQTILQIHEQFADFTKAVEAMRTLHGFSDAALRTARMTILASKLMNVATACVSFFSLFLPDGSNAEVLAAIANLQNELRSFRDDFRDFERATQINFMQLGFGINRVSMQLMSVMNSLDHINENLGQVQTGIQSLQNQMASMSAYFAGQSTQRLRDSENQVTESCGFRTVEIDISTCIARIKSHYNDNLQHPDLTASQPTFPMNQSLGLMPLYAVTNDVFRGDYFQRSPINSLLWLGGAAQNARLFDVMQSMPPGSPLSSRFRQALPELCRLNEDFLSFQAEAPAFPGSIRHTFQLHANENASLQIALDSLVVNYNRAAQQVREGVAAVRYQAVMGQSAALHGQSVDPFADATNITAEAASAVRSGFNEAPSCHTFAPTEFPSHTELGPTPVPVWLKETLANQDIYAHIAAQRAGETGIQFCYDVEVTQETRTEDTSTVRGTWAMVSTIGAIGVPPVPIAWHTGVFHHQSRAARFAWRTLFNRRVIRQTVSSAESFPHQFTFTIEDGRDAYNRYPSPRWPSNMFNTDDITRRSWNNFHDNCVVMNALYGARSCTEPTYLGSGPVSSYRTSYSLEPGQMLEMLRNTIAASPEHFRRYNAHGLRTLGSVTDDAAYASVVSSNLNSWRQRSIDAFVDMISMAFSNQATVANPRVADLRSALRALDRARFSIEAFFRIYLPTSTQASEAVQAILSYSATANDQTRLATIMAYEPELAMTAAISRIGETQPTVALSNLAGRRQVNVAQTDAIPRFSDSSVEYDYYTLCLPSQMIAAHEPARGLIPHHLPRSTDVFCDIMSFFLLQPSAVAQLRPQPREFSDVSMAVDRLLSSLNQGSEMLTSFHSLVSPPGVSPSQTGYNGHLSRFDYEQQSFRSAAEALLRNRGYCRNHGIAAQPYAHSVGQWGVSPF